MPIINVVPSPNSSTTSQTGVNTGDDAKSSSRKERAIAALMGQPSPQQQIQQQGGQLDSADFAALKAENASQTAEDGQSANNGVSDPVDTKAPPSPTPQDATTKHYAQLARKERELRARTESLKAKEAAIAAKEQELSARDSKFTEDKYIPRDRLKQDYWKYLTEEGIDYSQVTQEALAREQAQDPTARHMIEQLKAEIKGLRESQDKTTKTFEEQQTKSYEQAVNQIRSEVKQSVASNPDFETIHATNSVDDVVELITRTFEKEGVLLSVEEAAREVEEYLVEEAIKLSKIKKLQDKFGIKAPSAGGVTNPASQTAASAQAKQEPGATVQAKTLSNSMNATRKLSARERAILAAQGKLTA